MQFTGEQLSDQDLLKIWKAYDTSGDGKMDREELAFLMEDLCEVKQHARFFRCPGAASRYDEGPLGLDLNQRWGYSRI